MSFEAFTQSSSCCVPVSRLGTDTESLAMSGDVPVKARSAGAIKIPAITLNVRAVAITRPSSASSARDTRIGCSSTWKLIAASTVDSTAINTKNQIPPGSILRVSTTMSGQCHRYVP
jgi:hypothetical protein